MNNQRNWNYIYVPGMLSQAKTDSLLQAVGLKTTEATFRDVSKLPDGSVLGAIFHINPDGEAVGLSEKDAAQASYEDNRIRNMASELRERYISRISIVPGPIPRMGVAEKPTTISAEVAGKQMNHIPVTGTMLSRLIRGEVTEKEVAAHVFYSYFVNQAEELVKKAEEKQQVQTGEIRSYYLDRRVHKDQLRMLLSDCGFTATPDTFKNLRPDSLGFYNHFVIQVVDGVAMDIVHAQGEDQLKNFPNFAHLYEALGQKCLSDVAISTKHPAYGYNASNGEAFLTCKLHGEVMNNMVIGKHLYSMYQKCEQTAEQIAAAVYCDELIDYRKEVHIPVDCGVRISNGSETLYYTDNNGEGECYKDMKAFDEQTGICYMSEADNAEYNADRLGGCLKPIEEYGQSYTDLVNHARSLAIRNPVEVARHCLQNCTWQSPYTELEEFHNHCEPEDILTLEEEIEDMFDRYVEEHDCMPNYAEVFIEYKDDKNSQRVMIALCPDAGENADDEVVFTCKTFEDFKRLATEDNGEDFVIREIYGYHAGSMDGQKHTFDDANIHDELDETIRQAEQAEERVIEVDMDMTPQQLKDVLAKEGIKLLDVLPGIDEPLPLNKENGNVSHVYLRVADDVVIDCADEYQYRDAACEQPGLKIESLKGMAAAHSRQTEWYNDLSRISDVRIFRNPMNTSSTEFRMRCKIDGEQQMSRVLHPAEVEKLANGYDRIKMASEVFSRQMTLNNPLQQDKKNGLGR